MFPGVDGFHWTTGHIVFVTAFLFVLAAIAATMFTAVSRATVDLRHSRAAAIRWHADFEELPQADRACRHQLTAEIAERSCPNGFDCRQCIEHPNFSRRAIARAANEYCGLPYPSWRYYHRGHTFVEPLDDGTLGVGLDEFARRVVGRPDEIELPEPGISVDVNGTAWRMKKHGLSVRVLSPVDGEVVATGGPDDPWYLRVKPRSSPADLRHLLRGAEVGAWIQRELERLMPAKTMADGGVLIHDLMAAQPGARWDEILGTVFLEP